MIVRQNLHTHTTFCDGLNPPKDMVMSAVNKGMTSIGFSGHALTEHDKSYCMSRENTFKYRDELLRLREEYKDTVKIYIGLEQDYYSVEPLIKTDYLIGSVHYVLKDSEYIPVDETKEWILDAVNRLYNGDIYSFLEDYYNTLADVYNKTKCDIIGHFDLPEKFNRDGKFFDRQHPRYVAAYERAMKILIKQGRIFEINTGGMAKGYTDFPYPNEYILRKIAALGGKVTVSSDSHSVETIDFKLDKMCKLAYDCGFKEIYQLGDNGFYSINIEVSNHL